MTDEELVTGVLEGDEVAWREFVQRFEKLVWSLVLQLLNGYSREDQEDAYQEVFLRVCRKLNSWNGGWLQVWVGRVAVRRLLDFRQRLSKGKTEGIEGETVDPKGANPVDEMALAECVEKVVNGLPQPHQRLVELLLEGVAKQEVQAILGVPRATFYYWLRNVRLKLEKCLE